MKYLNLLKKNWKLCLIFFILGFVLCSLFKSNVEGLCICNNGTPASPGNPKCSASPSKNHCESCDENYNLINLFGNKFCIKSKSSKSSPKN